MLQKDGTEAMTDFVHRIGPPTVEIEHIINALVFLPPEAFDAEWREVATKRLQELGRERAAVAAIQRKIDECIETPAYEDADIGSQNTCYALRLTLDEILGR